MSWPRITDGSDQPWVILLHFRWLCPWVRQSHLLCGFLLLSFPFQALTKNDGSTGEYAHDGVVTDGLGTGPSPDLLIPTLEGKAHREKLELVASFSFFGNVMSMASVQLAGAKRDALLLSFKDAKVSGVSLAGGPGHSGVTQSSAGLGSVSVFKVGIEWAMLLTSCLQLSVVEYDPGTHDLKTLSLHYFEEPELRDGFVQNVHTPRVRVDPDGRCAAMLIYGTRLVVLPFRRESLAEEHEGLMGEG